ncbi:hypothetical protein Cde04nite_32550 [Cellulomonas denverensis]|nr:hypothetical protein Cde04nite_32550 [Cellulomonas denverensis]
MALQRSRPRAGARALNVVGDTTARGVRAIGDRVGKVTSSSPTLSRTTDAVARAARRVAGGVQDLVPGPWVSGAAQSAERAVASIARTGLTPERVVGKHQRRGHDVELLIDVRALDLQQVDAVKGWAFKTYYPGLAAASGAISSAAITGGQLAIPVSGGAAAAPAGGVVFAAVAGDIAAVLALASRVVGQVALAYGYDARDPNEKVFVLSVVNAGTAMSSTAKLAAMAELSSLTQQLYRGATWKAMDSTIARLYTQFASKFALRYTKQSLGRFVPALGVVVGASFNWATLESIVDAADLAYRRRFLLEKYPFLAEQPPVSDVKAAIDAEPGMVADVAISVLDELAEAGGPDLRASFGGLPTAEH